MSFVGDLIGDVFGGITGAKQSGEAAERAGATQAAAAQQGIEEQRRQFDKFIELMAPYVTAGTSAMGRLSPYEQAGTQAFGQQQALIGMQGPEAQRSAIQALEQSPAMQMLVRQGENAILQNAAATGGLRGGNVQAALAQFRPQMLDALIEQQYGRLGGLAGTGLGVTSGLVNLGQASAAGQAAAGQTLGVNVSGLLGQQGAATAGGQLARGNVARQTFGDMLQIGGTIAGAMGGGQGLRPRGSIFG